MRSAPIPSPEETVTTPAEASPASGRGPLRSYVFVGLIVVTILTTLLDTNLFRQTGVCGYATLLATVALSPITLLSLLYVLVFDGTEDKNALNLHFTLSYAFCRLFCLGVFLSRIFGSGLTVRDFFLCWKIVSMTFTCGMLSAVWMHGGVEALKREMRAVPSNLWTILYGQGAF